MQKKIIATAQLVSFLLMWVFVIGIIIWIINLISISVELHDVPGVSLGISLIAIPVFTTLASILTYAYFGFKKKENNVTNNSSGEAK
jgi:membrane protein implicated in regulation of membrane protease activity